MATRDSLMNKIAFLQGYQLSRNDLLDGIGYLQVGNGRIFGDNGPVQYANEHMLQGLNKFHRDNKQLPVQGSNLYLNRMDTILNSNNKVNDVLFQTNNNKPFGMINSNDFESNLMNNGFNNQEASGYSDILKQRFK